MFIGMLDPEHLFSLAEVPYSPAIPALMSVKRNSVALNWNPPRRDGGSPVSGYAIEMKEVNSNIWKKVAETPRNGTSDVSKSQSRYYFYCYQCCRHDH